GGGPDELGVAGRGLDRPVPHDPPPRRRPPWRATRSRWRAHHLSKRKWTWWRRGEGRHHGQPTPGTSTSTVQTCPERRARFASTLAGSSHSAVRTKSVRRSSPPRTHAKHARSARTT